MRAAGAVLLEPCRGILAEYEGQRRAVLPTVAAADRPDRRKTTTEGVWRWRVC
jgi:hypothetical protein